MKTYDELIAIHGRDKTKVKIHIDPSDMFLKNSVFKNHRHYVESLFKDRGYEVTRFGHTYKGDQVKDCGLIYCRTDSDIYPTLEVVGIEGVSIKALNAARD